MAGRQERWQGGRSDGRRVWERTAGAGLIGKPRSEHPFLQPQRVSLSLSLTFTFTFPLTLTLTHTLSLSTLFHSHYSHAPLRSKMGWFQQRLNGGGKEISWAPPNRKQHSPSTTALDRRAVSGNRHSATWPKRKQIASTDVAEEMSVKAGRTCSQWIRFRSGAVRTSRR